MTLAEATALAETKKPLTAKEATRGKKVFFLRYDGNSGIGVIAGRYNSFWSIRLLKDLDGDTIHWGHSDSSGTETGPEFKDERYWNVPLSALYAFSEVIEQGQYLLGLEE